MIGLDGLSWDLLRPWIEKNDLPFFKKIIEKGVSSKLITQIPCSTVPCVPSFYTGKNPASTGLFGFRSGDGSIISYNNVKDPAFWDLMKNRKSMIVNVITTYPPKINNGVIVSGANTPSEKCEYVYPNKYKSNFKGFHKDFFESKKGVNQEELSKIYAKVTNNKFKKFEKMFFKEKFDFSIFYVTLTDYIQHHCWNNKKVILAYLKKIESVFEHFLNKIPAHNIILFSDHGHESSPKNIFYINEWLERKNYLCIKGSKARQFFIKRVLSFYNNLFYALGWGATRLLSQKVYNHLFKFAKKISFEGIKNPEKDSHKALGKELLSVFKKRNDIIIEKVLTNLSELDMNKTKAFLDQKWGITIVKKNVKNYDLFRNKIIKELKNVKDSYGNKIFKAVYKKEEVYKGKYLSLAPDIIFLFYEYFEARKGFSSKLISKIKVKRYFRSGQVYGSHENAREGIFMAYGIDIRKGEKLDAISILDLAPTVLHMMKSPIPEDSEGKVINMFKRNSGLSKRKIKYSNVTQIDKEKELIRSLLVKGKI